MIPTNIEILGGLEYAVDCVLEGGEHRRLIFKMNPDHGMNLSSDVDDLFVMDALQARFLTRTVMALHRALQSEKLLKTA